MQPIPITMVDAGIARARSFAESIEQPLLGVMASSACAEVISPDSSTEIS